MACFRLLHDDDDDDDYVLPRTRTKFGERGFFYTAQPPVTLPSDLHDITGTSTLQNDSKNVLFDRAYN